MGYFSAIQIEIVIEALLCFDGDLFALDFDGVKIVQDDVSFIQHGSAREHFLRWQIGTASNKVIDEHLG